MIWFTYVYIFLGLVGAWDGESVWSCSSPDPALDFQNQTGHDRTLQLHSNLHCLSGLTSHLN